MKRFISVILIFISIIVLLPCFGCPPILYVVNGSTIVQEELEGFEYTEKGSILVINTKEELDSIGNGNLRLAELCKAYDKNWIRSKLILIITFLGYAECEYTVSGGAIGVGIRGEREHDSSDERLPITVVVDADYGTDKPEMWGETGFTLFHVKINPPKQPSKGIYNIDGLYEKVLTEKDLYNIAYHSGCYQANASIIGEDFVPSKLGELPEEIESKIKEQLAIDYAYFLQNVGSIHWSKFYFKRSHIKDGVTADDVTAEGFSIVKYFGQYGDCYAFCYESIYEQYDGQAWEFKIDGVRFLGGPEHGTYNYILIFKAVD